MTRTKAAATLSLSALASTLLMPLAAQASPLGRWQPPLDWSGTTLSGCAGNQAERFYSVHCSLIPVGPHRGKLLIWDRSEAVTCSLYNGQFSGDRDQRWAIVDPEGPTSIPPRPLITHISASRSRQPGRCTGVPDGTTTIGARTTSSARPDDRTLAARASPLRAR